MRRLIGTSVGDWNTSQKVYPNSQYSNIGGNLNLGGGFKNKICGKFIVPPQMCNISLSEWSSRASANKSLKEYGLSQAEIEEAWTQFKSEVQSNFERNKFINFAKAKVQSQSNNQTQTSAGASPSRGRSNIDAEYVRGTYPELDQVRDSVLRGASKVNRGGAKVNSEMGGEPSKNSNSKYLLYGGIGLAVIVGAFLIFRKK